MKKPSIRLALVLGVAMFAAAPFAVTAQIGQTQQVEHPAVNLNMQFSSHASAGLIP